MASLGLAVASLGLGSSLGLAVAWLGLALFTAPCPIAAFAKTASRFASLISGVAKSAKGDGRWGANQRTLKGVGGLVGVLARVWATVVS